MNPKQRYRFPAIEVYDKLPLNVGPIECEWGTYLNDADGTECDMAATFIVLDTEDRSDPTYPEGFHEAHLCGVHLAAVKHHYGG